VPEPSGDIAASGAPNPLLTLGFMPLFKVLAPSKRSQLQSRCGGQGSRAPGFPSVRLPRNWLRSNSSRSFLLVSRCLTMQLSGRGIPQDAAATVALVTPLRRARAPGPPSPLPALAVEFPLFQSVTEAPPRLRLLRRARAFGGCRRIPSPSSSWRGKFSEPIRRQYGRGNGAHCIAKVARGWMLQLLLGCRRGPFSYIQRIGIDYVLQE
jgi:hypothetical protein